VAIACWWSRHGDPEGATGGRRATSQDAAPESVAAAERSSDPGVASDVAPSRRALAAVVKRVVDGDTVVVEVAGSITPVERVRLLRVNTPERGRPGCERATAALIALADGKRVELDFEDPEKPERDEYGRLLAYVHVDGLCANVELVRAGWSRFFTKYGKGRHSTAFERAEAAARRSSAGLWRADEWNPADRR
jgi:micrococcal nuclease